MSLRALLLGPPRITTGGAETLLSATRPAALLAYLACRGSWVTRDELALVFRPDAGDAEARIYLRKLIFRARALPFAADLDVTDERIRWAIPSDLADLRSAVAAGDWSAAARIDAGALLDGLHVAGLPGFEAWLEIEREAAAAHWRRGVTQRAAELEAAGGAADAIGLRERYLEREPLDEEVVQDLLRALEGGADRSRGLAAYDAFARHLERDVGAQPSEVTQALADALRALPSVSGPRFAAPPTAHDALPRPATSFIGRRVEIDRLAGLLRPEGPRLVTIVGLGGVGKTRLALEAVRGVTETTATRVVFVPLAPPPPGGRLIEAIAAALGLDADEDRVHAALNHGVVLLLLDDAEDVMADGGAIEADALLRRVPALRLVVTSRVPLGLAAEHIVPVEGLGTPATASAADRRDSDAVALFLRRAASVSPEILDDPETLRHVGEICRSLGGLPLAIELAASWTRTLSVSALLDELREGEDLLRTDATDVPERQRSVRVVIEQAWQGLRADHRDALARLTVFRGPWSLAAARDVAGADLATMLALLSSSLVRRSNRDRFEMHELVRRAAPAAPEGATHDAHARHTLGWLREVGPDLTSGDQAAALAAVHASLSDVREAWHHAARRGMVDEIAGALVALDHALHGRSLWTVASEAYRVALDHLPATPAAAVTRVRLQVRLANIERNVGDTEAARERLRTALGDRDVRGRPQVEARLELAKLDDFVSAFGAAISSYREVLADAGPDDDDLRGAAHTGLGNVLFSSGGDTSEAMHHYEEGLRAARRSREMDLVTIALINMGAGHYDIGQLDAARRSWREAAALAAQLGNQLREASTLNNLAALAERSGDLAAAREAYDRSLRVRQEVGDRRGAARVLLNLGRLAQAEGRIDDADALVEASVATYETLDTPADLAHALATRARLRVALGDLGGAERMTERALRLGRVASDRTSMLVGLLSAATIALRRGRSQEARRGAGLVAALTLGTKEGVRSSALALLREAETAIASECPQAPNRDATAEMPAAAPEEAVLAAEVDRLLRRG